MAYRKTELPPFSKIAFRNLGNDKIIVERLNREMEMWIRSKKGVDDLIERIRKVTGMSLGQAKRVARTERTRVQGQARYEAIRDANLSRGGGEAALKKQWVARNDAFTRDSHLPMSGQLRKATEYFVSGAGNRLMYPGDPRAPVEEIINCRCYMRKVGAGEVLEAPDFDGRHDGYIPLTDYDFVDKINVDVPPDVRAVIDGAGKKVTADFPTLDKYLDAVGFGGGDAENPAAVSLAITQDGYVGQILSLNRHIWDDLEKVKDIVRREALSGGHIASDSPEAIITHEYGHVAYNSLALKRIGYTKGVPLTHLQRKLFGMERDRLKKDIGAITEKFDSPLSERAMDSYSEAAAEAFSDYFSGKRSKLANAIVRLFRKELG